jgi:amino acid adenylation domain-containing protein
MSIVFDRSEIEQSVGARLHRLAEQLPRQESIRCGSDSISYSELDSASDRVARHLLTVRGPAPEPVAVLIEQGIPSLTAILGILKAGKSFSILPPQFPQDRLSAIWNDLQQPPLLTNNRHRDLALTFSRDPGLVLDFEAATASRDSTALPVVSPDALGAIVYTSATTGDPKGVMMSHRMILHTGWQNGDLYRIAPGDRLAYISAYGFGAAITACFAAILNGATLCFPAEKTDHLRSILSWLRKNNISIFSLTTFGLFRQQVSSREISRIPLPDLRLVLLGGEDLYPPDLGVFWRIFPEHTALSYRLAGSETMLMRENRIAHQTLLPAGKIPVGQAVPDKELLLVDEDHHPVPDGQIGEIAIRTRFLASGYWRKPELYAEKFQSDPARPDVKIYLSGDVGRLAPDGQLEYLGRQDNVVKVRGFGIRLEDVERAVQLLAGIEECSAAALSLPSGDKQLAAYIVQAPGASLAVEDLRHELANTLPRFMIPSVFIFLDRLPRTATGKVDRSKLPQPDTTRPALRTPYVPPATDLEKKLCAEWADLLRIDSVGIHDNFFDLGGDSLLALHLSFRMEDQFKQPIPPTFFTLPTVAALVSLWQTGALPPEGKAGGRTGKGLRRRKNTLKRISWVSTPVFHDSRRRNRREKLFSDPLILFRVLISTITLQLPYLQGSQWAAGFASQPWARRFFFREKINLFRQFIQALDGAPEAPEFALETNLTGNILWSRFARRGVKPTNGRFLIEQWRKSRPRYWRNLAWMIEQGPDELFNRFFTVSGLEHLEGALRKGRGVIITTYHNTANRIAMAALPRRLRCEPIPTISIMRALQLEKHRMHEDRDEFVSAADEGLMASLTLEGRRLLEEGKIIQIVPDNTMDTVGHRPLVIGGRRFNIKPGMAEYALLTGAAIVPQFSTRRLDGSVHMTFLPPFVMPPETTAREERIYSILQQYAAFVDFAWRHAPEAINWISIEKLLRKPRVQPDSDAGVEERISSRNPDPPSAG